MESTGTYVLIEFHARFLLGTDFCQTALRGSGGYHLQRDGMLLHDAVELNCKSRQASVGSTTEHQGAGEVK